MEFNIDTNKVIGIVDHKLGGESARIKILAIESNNKEIVNLTERQAIELFHPTGFVFEPGFFHNHSFNVRDVVSFFVFENEKSVFGDDKYRINDRKQVKNYGVDARHITGFSKKNQTTNLSLVRIDKNEKQSNGNFYGITDKYIIGRLRIHDGIISPALHSRIKVWDIEELEFIEHNGIVRILKEPDGESLLLDCMNDKQLFEWFRNELKEVEPDFVKLLDSNAKWRLEIPKLFSQTDEEKYEVDKIRFSRINEKFRLINLSLSDIKMLVEKSDSLRDTFNQAIENHKEELKQGYTNSLEEYRTEFEEQKKFLDKELIALEKKKEGKHKILNSLKDEIEISNKKIESLNKNKERILADFSIIKDVLSIGNNLEKSVVQQDSFILEDVEKPNNSLTFSSREEFISALQYQLNKYELFPNFANRLLDVISIYKGTFIKDIKLGIAFIEAISNTKFVIQQVEPDWLHFSDFWNNGLGAIWQSAHKHPDILHFLFLEDINLSSPECYARPLFDMINGIRKHIPYGKTVYPENLKILATKASTENPEIGLPLIEQTFTGWGAVGFNGDIYKKTDNEFKTVKGFINSNLLLSFQPDEFEITDIKSVMQQDFNNLFETE